MEEKSLHRDWVKNVAIIFLAVLLVLTFFSNTIMNRTLPEIASKQITQGAIVAQVRLNGTVSAEGAYEVKAPSSREIRTVMVRVGDKVEAGNVLFVLGEGDSEELEQAQDNLRTLQLSYQRAAAGMQNYDYTMEEREISRSKKTLDAAQAEYDRIKALITDAGSASEEVIKAALEKRDNAKNTWSELVALRENAIAEAEADMNAKAAEYEAAHKALLAYKQPTVATALEEEIMPLVGEGEVPPVEPTPTPSTGDAELDRLTEADAAAEKALEDAKAKYAALVGTEDAAIAAAKANYEKAAAEYDALMNANGLGKYQAELESAETKLDDAKYSYDRLVYELNQKKTSDGKSQYLASLELGEIGTQIEKAKKKLSELSGGEENVITANVGGTIQGINITAGNKANKGDVLCSIEVPDMGYTLTATVTADQARRLHVGDTASVNNYYWGSQINATIRSIQNDPKNPQQSRIITCTLEGDVTAGNELKLSVGSRSANYDTIVPNSAIRSDSNGKFVLVIEEKSSPLGNRYIATRQSIEVLAEDDENSAVSGTINQGDFVITTSSKPIKAGDQVRMAG